MYNISYATFGAGCFWGVEEVFRKLPGIKETAVGYMGGILQNPTYEDVCSHTTGHAETVQIQYDPAKISYEKLLDVFWNSHNPTTKNRQGPDIGDQYRSVIFYHTPEQKTAAEESKAALEKLGKWKLPIVTEITPVAQFYRAEEYHQKYLIKRGGMPQDEKYWKEKLTPEQYRILREKGTETAFTGKFYKHHEKGMYVCAGCGANLFSSDTKYDSGSGWPSFWDAVKADAVKLHDDSSHGMLRVEATCANCGGHLGHVFDDGPKEKTGKRFCINSACLDFKHS
ncbi:peptide-methionine (S)-S-oxide reductase MsrA [Candidatus Peregrinibacteria bacterium]|nr:peptide-methionine (S)-S-oxide reductase MsrA [Candidatus Peregrinibacteria bacterium]